MMTSIATTTRPAIRITALTVAIPTALDRMKAYTSLVSSITVEFICCDSGTGVAYILFMYIASYYIIQIDPMLYGDINPNLKWLC